MQTPDGFVLVPEELSEEMESVFISLLAEQGYDIDQDSVEDVRYVWAMLMAQAKKEVDNG
ncbi:hypothetical protein Erwinia_phage_Pastis_00017 [Erwinia phage Pastis]|nr:hypothetical protein Erwinia_phage_Pastis_00017 [Erwinia phage Pastis]